MGKHTRDDLVTLGEDWPVWDRIFTVNPLVLIGTRERAADTISLRSIWRFPWAGRTTSGSSAPRVTRPTTTPDARVFTVSYPKPTQIVLASLSATRREGDGSKPGLYALRTFPASEVDGVFIEDAYLFLECVLDRIVDDFGENSLIAGRVVAAHVSEDYLRTSDRDDNDLIHDSQLIAYLSPGRYACVRDSNSFPFPANFMR